jgi:hypothetical protein
MSEQRFSISFEGPALDTHQMDVRDLAPALLALADTVKAANVAINADKADVRLDVIGKPKSGSFGLDLTIAQKLLTQFTDLFSGSGATALANAYTLLGALGLVGGHGLLWLLKKIKGRKTISIKPYGDYVRLTLEDNETIEVDLFTGKLFQDRQTRIELVRALKPLERDGVDSLLAGIDGELQTVCEKTDYYSILASAEEEILLNRQELEQIVLIEAAVFKDGNKWRFNNGQSFHAEILDGEFIQRMESGEERFGKGDRLRVLLEVRQYDVLNKLETRYSVLKVLEHLV